MYVVACYDSNELFYRCCITRSKVASPQYKITRSKVAQFFSVKLTESPPSTPGENKKETMKKKSLQEAIVTAGRWLVLERRTNQRNFVRNFFVRK